MLKPSISVIKWSSNHLKSENPWDWEWVSDRVNLLLKMGKTTWAKQYKSEAADAKMYSTKLIQST